MKDSGSTTSMTPAVDSDATILYAAPSSYIAQNEQGQQNVVPHSCQKVLISVPTGYTAHEPITVNISVPGATVYPSLAACGTPALAISSVQLLSGQNSSAPVFLDMGSSGNMNLQGPYMASSVAIPFVMNTPTLSFSSGSFAASQCIGVSAALLYNAPSGLTLSIDAANGSGAVSNWLYGSTPYVYSDQSCNTALSAGNNTVSFTGGTTASSVYIKTQSSLSTNGTFQVRWGTALSTTGHLVSCSSGTCTP